MYAEIQDHLQHSLGNNCDVLYLPEVQSTNDWAKRPEFARKLTRPALIYTAHQTAGRGTRGRSWEQQPERDLALTITAPLPGRLFRDMRLSLAIGACVARVVEETTGIETRVKWPNDVLAPAGGGAEPHWRKVAGILLETCDAGPHLPDARVLVAGVGINVNSTASEYPPELATRLTTLRDAAGGDVDAAGLHERVMKTLLQFVQSLKLEATGSGRDLLLVDSWVAIWRSRDATAGARYILTRDGEQREIVARRIDETGALVAEDSGGGVHTITSYTELAFPHETGQ
jgi:BirA family biotin operon repressor/biotin-[acetyl-CoA-carboxylase] ligase